MQHQERIPPPPGQNTATPTDHRGDGLHTRCLGNIFLWLKHKIPFARARVKPGIHTYSVFFFVVAILQVLHETLLKVGHSFGWTKQACTDVQATYTTWSQERETRQDFPPFSYRDIRKRHDFSRLLVNCLGKKNHFTHL